MSTNGKVIWAVDPFPKDKKVQFATFKALAKMTEGTEALIEPVAVLSPDQLYIPKKLFDGTAKQYHLEAETLLKEWVKQLGHPRLTAPVLLVQDLYSSSITVDALLNHAKKTKARLIAVGTHTKKVLQRFLLGSFAESLILKSDVPILVVNPRTGTATKKIAKILFPTDFSAPSKQAFHEVLHMAAGLGAKVLIYHKLDLAIPGAPFGMPYIQDHSRYYKEASDLAKKTGKAWTAEGNNAGVKTEFKFEETPFYIPEGIVRAAAKSKTSLIAIASQATASRAALLGSIARQVVRMSSAPVWILNMNHQESSQNPNLSSMKVNPKRSAS